METNTELLNRIEAHIKGRLAVAESRAASSEIYEGKKIAYTSILGFVNSLRTDLAAQARPAPADVQEAADNYEKSLDYYHYTNDEPRVGFAAGMLAERERLMKEAPVADVIEMRGNTEKGYPLELTLGFPRLPNIEYHGGAVRVIIEEIK